MSAKKPSLATQLRKSATEITERDKVIADLEKKLKDATSRADSFWRQRGEFEAEIAQVHSLLDALPDCIPRQSEPAEYGTRTSHALMTRLAAWLAVRK